MYFERWSESVWSERICAGGRCGRREDVSEVSPVHGVPVRIRSGILWGVGLYSWRRERATQRAEMMMGST